MLTTRAMGSELSEVESFTIDSMIRGYHIYKDVWSSFIGEVLCCRRDVRNHHDPFAIAISINGSKLSNFCRVTFMHGPFFCGSLASATALKTSLFASAIDAVGKWSNKGRQPFGSGSEAEISILLKYL